MRAPYLTMRCLAAALCLACATAPVRAEDAPAKPNVLFIAVDDLNDWIGALGGHPQSVTPNLDRLAERGVLFTRAYCSAPACNPSRASLMTGRRPSTSGVYHNPQPWRRAMPDAVTLPQHFMQHGYRAIGGGKIYHGAFPDPASWDEYFNRPGDPKPAKVPANGLGRTSHFDWGPVEEDDDAMGDTKLIDWATDVLGRAHEKPFFLAVGLYRPHLPWYAPKKYFDRFPPDKVTLPKVPADDLDDVPAAGVKIAKPQGDHRRVIESDNWGRAVSGYLACIAYVDGQIGRLIDALDGSKYAQNTIVVLWGDHGWHLGEKMHWRKFALWEEAARVPLMIAAPGVTKPGGRCARPVSLLDLYPTLLELCSAGTRDGLEGQSLASLLRDPSAKRERPAITTHGFQNHAVRSERWRYIRYADGSEELYDHDADPMEWTNLASKEEHAKVKADLAKWLPEVNAQPIPNRGAGNAARQERRQRRQAER